MKSTFALIAAMAAIGMASANSPAPSEAVPAPEQTAPAATAEIMAQQRNISVAVGEKQIIKLKSNPTTGYVWIISEGTKSEIVSVEADITFREARPEQPGQPPLCGAPSETIISFTGLKPGKEKIVLTHARPWEQPLQPTQIITVEVEVTEAPAK